MIKKIYITMTFLSLIVTFLLNASSHTGPDRMTYESIDAFTKEFVKKHQLKFLGTSGCGSGKRSLWSVSLTSNQTLNLEEGRKLAGELAFGLLHRIYHDPVFADYCKFRASKYVNLSNWVGSDASSPELIKEYAAFRLAFWGNNFNRPLFPYLAQIRLEDGYLYFHYADPETQGLQEPIVESLESLNLPNYKN